MSLDKSLNYNFSALHMKNKNPKLGSATEHRPLLYHTAGIILYAFSSQKYKKYSKWGTTKNSIMKTSKEATVVD